MKTIRWGIIGTGGIANKFADEARDMITSAKKNDVLLMEAMWSRFTPGIREAKRLIEEGAIGKVKLLKTDFCYFLKGPYPELGGGARLDVGTYFI